MPLDTGAGLQAPFGRFISKFLEYVDKYFSQNVAFLEAIGHFGNGIETLTWNHIQKCTEVTKIEGLNEDNLFDELKLTFEIIKKKKVPLFEPIQHFLSNEQEKEANSSLPMVIHKTRLTKMRKSKQK